MRFYISFIALMVAGYMAQAQAKISIGERGYKYDPAESINETMTVDALKGDTKLHVSAEGTSNSYIIAQYDISVLSENGNLIGPFTIKDKEEQKVFDNLYSYFVTGAKVYYDKIVLACRDCMPPKPINARGAVVTLR